MSKLSFIDKIRTLFEVSSSSIIFLLVFAIIGVFAFVFYKSNKDNSKKVKLVYLCSMGAIILFLLITYHSSLASMFDYMMNNFFIALYFPNLAIYLAAIIASNIILLISIFNYKVNKHIKNINITVYCLLNYILALVLNVINKNDLDVFKIKSVYENTEAQGLIELSSIIFIVWILFLIIYRIIMIYLKKEYEMPVKKVYVKKKVKILPENIKEVNAPKVVYTDHKIQEEPIIVPLTKEDKILEEIEKSLTIEDYKKLLKILKKHKKK